MTKDIVSSATAINEETLYKRKSEYSTARLDSDTYMLDDEPRSILDKSLLERNALYSPLLRLPPEVRNAIYAYALGGYVIDIYDASSQRRHVALHLLETCRQIYIEARMVPFIRNTFFCPSSTTRMPWSPRLPGQIQAITTVSLHVYRGAAGTREQTEKSVDDLVLESFTGLRRLELLFFNYFLVLVVWRSR